MVGKLGGSMREAVRYVFGQRSIASLLLLTALPGRVRHTAGGVHVARDRTRSNCMAEPARLAR